MTKKNKKDKIEVKPFMVKNYLWVFINSQIINPAFDSQVSTCCWDPQIGQSALRLVGAQGREGMRQYVSVHQHMYAILIARAHLLVQTKETLTLRATAFGSKPAIPEAFIKKIEKQVCTLHWPTSLDHRAQGRRCLHLYCWPGLRQEDSRLTLTSN